MYLKCTDPYNKLKSIYGKGSSFTFKIPLLQTLEQSRENNESTFNCNTIWESKEKSLLDSSKDYLNQSLEIIETIERKEILIIESEENIISKPKILIVDDNEYNIFILRNLLHKFKLSVETALNGRDALDKLEQYSDYSLVFMDFSMPILSGEEVKHIELKQRPPVSYENVKEKD